MRGGVLIGLFVSGCFIKPGSPGTSIDAGDTTDDGKQDSGVDSPYAGANYMFVTSKTFLGHDLQSSSYADARCAEAATDGELPGTFVAWWSTSHGGTIHAKDRLGPTARGWIRTDGQPFVDTVADLVAGNIYTPPRYDEKGRNVWQAAPEELVYTGTSPAGEATGNDCYDNQDVLATVGVVDATKDHWTQITGPGYACSNTTFHLYCFGTDNDVTVQPTPVPSGALRAFVTDTNVSINEGLGASVFDAYCNSFGNELASGSYVAFVARKGLAARDVLPSTNANGWYRADGIKLVDDADFDSFFSIPLNYTNDQTYVVGSVYSGADTYTTQGTDQSTCNGWASTSNNHSAGDVQRGERSGWTGGPFQPCISSSRLYCFQTN